MDSYQSLSAKVYNFDKPVGTSFGDIEYYQTTLQTHGASDILEPAVGTGRMMIPLLKAGFNVKGFDLSSEMLEYCKINLEMNGFSQSLITQASFESFNDAERFDALIIPSGTFLLMTDYAEIRNALANFANHLKASGLLMFDIFFQPQFKPGNISIKHYDINNDERITLTMTEADIDYIHQVTTTYHRYEVWKAHQLERSELEIFKLKWLGLEELKLLLTNAGFSNINFIANYDPKVELSNESEIITVSAIKVR